MGIARDHVAERYRLHPRPDIRHQRRCPHQGEIPRPQRAQRRRQRHPPQASGDPDSCRPGSSPTRLPASSAPRLMPLAPARLEREPPDAGDRAQSSHRCGDGCGLLRRAHGYDHTGRPSLCGCTPPPAPAPAPIPATCLAATCLAATCLATDLTTDPPGDLPGDLPGDRLDSQPGATFPLPP